MVDTKKALEVAQYPWRVEQGGRYSLPSMDEVGYVVGTIKELVDEVERLRKELSSSIRDEWVSEDDMREKWKTLLAAAKALKRSFPTDWSSFDKAIEACEKGDHSAHIDLCREQVVELLEAKSKEVKHEDE